MHFSTSLTNFICRVLDVELFLIIGFNIGKVVAKYHQIVFRIVLPCTFLPLVYEFAHFILLLTVLLSYVLFFSNLIGENCYPITILVYIP